MSKGAVNFNEDRVEYYTPTNIVNYFGVFDYDPATTAEKAAEMGIRNYDTIDTDGLKSNWGMYDRIWINPPFNLKHQFFEKACDTVRKYGKTVFFLYPIAFLTTKRFHKTIKGLGYYIYLPTGRIKFENQIGEADKSPAFGSVILELNTGFYRIIKTMEI